MRCHKLASKKDTSFETRGGNRRKLNYDHTIIKEIAGTNGGQADDLDDETN